MGTATQHRLSRYREKRDFAATPEPSAERVHKKRDKALEFVVQKHDATRLHYDVRLEIDGAMMSFAVPKGPSYDPAVKRLAVETEDHPMAYNAFEGGIPEGEYGAGDLLVWDRGTYETLPPGEQAAQRAKGHIHVRLHGDKLVGDWHFVRSRRRDAPSDRPQWLMFKGAEGADPTRDVVSSSPESVLSGRVATRGPARGRASRDRTARALAGLVTEVEKATRVKSTGALGPLGGWIFELKYDGCRILAAKVGEDVWLTGPDGRDWTARFDVIARAVRALPARECLLDGEVCAVDAHGVPSRERLERWTQGDGAKQRRAGGARDADDAEDATARLSYAAFDLLWLDARDVRALPLERRRELLGSLLATEGGREWTRKGARAAAGRARGSPIVPSNATSLSDLHALDALLKMTCARGLSGLVAKRRGTPYAEGRTRDWLELACGPRAKSAKAPPPSDEPPRRAVKLSNPDKVLFPADGITKRDLEEYYTAVAPVLLPHLAGRPVSLQRWPNGIREPAWYQQNAPPKTPAFVRLVPIEDRRQIVVENADTLRWLTNLAALTIHQFGAHVPADATTKEQVRAALALPDYVIFDLDPGSGTWAHLVEVARALRTLLDGLELESAVKTSGKRGVHVVVPIARVHGHDEVLAFAEKVARAVAKHLPRIATVERMKAKRGGRLYVDCLQNGESKTLVAPYSVRALDGAPVSMPIRWSELDGALDPSTFTIRTVLRRIERHGDLFAGALAGKRRLPAL